MALRFAFIQPSCMSVHYYSRGRCVLLGRVGVFLLTLIHAALSPACPPIHIKTGSYDWQYQCHPECRPGYFCSLDGFCTPCAHCPDPYTLAELGRTEMTIMPECIDKGHCPRTCAPNGDEVTQRANVSMCYCVDVTPPPPEPTPIVCKDGCRHGDCEMHGECNCEAGWKGELCDQCVQDCLNGHCNTSSGECACSLGWGGTLCDQDLSYCGNNQPCQNGGTCLNREVGDYSCQCPEDFTGANCESAATTLPVCEESCRNNGTCHEMESGTFKCHCPEGFTGTHCQDAEGTLWWVYVLCGALGVLIVAVILIMYCCRRKLHFWKILWPLNNDSDIQLITKELPYELSGNTVTLKDLQNWTHCAISTCKCLPDFPVQITDGMKEFTIRDLHGGFTYCFEICRQTSSNGGEDGGCCIADCHVRVPDPTSEEAVCTGTLEMLEGNVLLCSHLSSILADSGELRKYISNFFQLDGRHKETFEKSGRQRYADDLSDILGAVDKRSCTAEALSREMARCGPARAEDFVQELSKSHQSCKVCPRILHSLHGGTTVWGTQHMNEVSTDSFTKSISM